MQTGEMGLGASRRLRRLHITSIRYSVSVLSCRVDDRDDSLPVMNIIKELNLDLHAASAKTNLGLGRPRYEDRIKEGGLRVMTHTLHK